MGRGASVSGPLRTRSEYLNVERRSGKIPKIINSFKETVEGEFGDWQRRGYFSVSERLDLRQRADEFLHEYVREINRIIDTKMIDASINPEKFKEYLDTLDHLWIEIENKLLDLKAQRQAYRGSDIPEVLFQSANVLRGVQQRIEGIVDFYS